jgi:hypothetical protein
MSALTDQTPIARQPSSGGADDWQKLTDVFKGKHGAG